MESSAALLCRTYYDCPEWRVRVCVFMYVRRVYALWFIKRAHRGSIVLLRFRPVPPPP